RDPGLSVRAQSYALGAAPAVERDDPEVAVWDLGADPLGWLERLGDLAESGPPALALLLDEEAAAAALAAGARGLLFRDVEGSRLAAALRALGRDRLAFDDHPL